MFNAANNSGKGGGFSFGVGGSSSGGFGSGASGGNLFGSQTSAASEAPKTTSTFSFGGAAAGGSGSGGSGLFGSQTAAKPEAPKTTPFSFGGAGGAPAGGSLFGGQTSAAASEAPKSTGFTLSSSTASGGLFGASKPEASKPAFGFGASAPAASAATTTATPSFGALGSGSSLFGAKPAAPASTAVAAPAATTAAATTASTGFSFGSAATPSTTGGSSKPLTFGGFGAKSTAAETKSEAAPTSTTAAAAAANPTTGTGFGGFKLSTAPAVSASDAGKPKESETTTTSKPAVSGTSADTNTAPKAEDATDLANAALRGKTLEEIAQMWTTELTTQTRAFHTQANTVGYWDRALVQQGKRITELYEATMGVEAEQAALDQSLEHMEGQQSALTALLDTYEGRVQDIVRKTTAPKPDSRGVAMTADQEREHVYSSAERLNQQLDELARRLTTLVEDVNDISSATPSTAGGEGGQRGTGADPFAQIVEILNAHLTSLEWVDSQTVQLQDRLKTAQRVYQDVASAQSSIPGNFGGDVAEPPVDQLDRDAPLTIPGAFVSEPLPPVTSSFGTPMSTARKPLSSLLARSAAGTSSPFGSTPRGRGF
ncbi:FG-nucleoporin nsp1 [Coemansia sp. RSA 2611]|nr:FG-nucleoporin nsp1 [Coemansia sp. RSA 2705]KAJ2322206.1 FG-nucleoporin nsp1 [Coemansia sp. RSA 2704]KAJ2370365.1 FG-nucleoporin nsp1 [Coemansia sp. RSA 2610]KAJ2393395.1 FG-nucleoporin nsp1 [Coemansia sp. RSA 2611]KAJ2739780.1 FG-nucleoporin nsp1 [Coemansia sp. Cherry 401B]